jgi:hypothetical protein
MARMGTTETVSLLTSIKDLEDIDGPDSGPANRERSFNVGHALIHGDVIKN